MSVKNVTMPQLGESITEGTIVRWLVQQGDVVELYTPLAEIQTDKVTAEVPSSFAGKVVDIAAREGDTLLVGHVICRIEVTENVIEDGVEQAKKVEKYEDVVQEKVAPNRKGEKSRLSPAVRVLLAQHQLSVDGMLGTGLGGRITRRDVERYIQQGVSAVEVVVPIVEEQAVLTVPREEVAIQTVQTSPLPSLSSQPLTSDERIPITGVRKTIAQNMTRAKQTIPHAWMMMEVDVTDLVAHRNRIKDEFKKKEGYALTYFPFFLKAVATALKEFPRLNGTVEGDTLVLHRDVHISIAVATEDALFVPVLRHVDERSIKGIARDIHEATEKARNKRLSISDSIGGTFTVNNTGSFGSIQSMGIINAPQVAILQVESIEKRPVFFENGLFGARDRVNLCLSLDHRVLDGLICGQFLQRVKQLLEGMNEHTCNLY